VQRERTREDARQLGVRAGAVGILDPLQPHHLIVLEAAARAVEDVVHAPPHSDNGGVHLGLLLGLGAQLEQRLQVHLELQVAQEVLPRGGAAGDEVLVVLAPLGQQLDLAQRAQLAVLQVLELRHHLLHRGTHAVRHGCGCGAGTIGGGALRKDLGNS